MLTRKEGWDKVLNEIATLPDVETQDRFLKVIGEYGHACAEDMFERMRKLRANLEKIST